MQNTQVLWSYYKKTCIEKEIVECAMRTTKARERLGLERRFSYNMTKEHSQENIRTWTGSDGSSEENGGPITVEEERQ